MGNIYGAQVVFHLLSTLRGWGEKTPVRVTYFTNSSMQALTIYTDGAAYHNGRDDCRASWGFWCEETNFSGSGFVIGKQTNNTGELTAILEAMRYAYRSGADEIWILSDSEYALNSIFKWKLKAWKANYDLILEAIVFAKGFKKVKFDWVRGHNELEGNEKADLLANNVLIDAGYRLVPYGRK